MEDMKEALIYVFALLAGVVGGVVKWLLGDRKRLLETIEKKEEELDAKEKEWEALRDKKDKEIKKLTEELGTLNTKFEVAVNNLEHFTGRRKRRNDDNSES